MFKKTLVVDGITPVGAYQALRTRSEGGSFLLESVVAGERWGRYSILGYRPKSQHVVYGEAGVDPFTRLSELAPAGGADEPDPVADLSPVTRVAGPLGCTYWHQDRPPPWQRQQSWLLGRQYS